MTSPLARIRLVVSGHDAEGKSMITYDSTVESFSPFGPGKSAFTVLHSTTTVPASNTAKFPVLEKTVPRCSPGGAIFCTNDFAPNSTSPMHRTASLDYAVVLSGELCMQLDGGEEVVFKTGDMIVQRGANHLWANRGSEWCRILCVMVGAQTIVLKDGTKLEQTVLGKPPGA